MSNAYALVVQLVSICPNIKSRQLSVNGSCLVSVLFGCNNQEEETSANCYFSLIIPQLYSKLHCVATINVILVPLWL